MESAVGMLKGHCTVYTYWNRPLLGGSFQSELVILEGLKYMYFEFEAMLKVNKIFRRISINPNWA